MVIWTSFNGKSNDNIRHVNNVVKWHRQCTFIGAKKNFYDAYHGRIKMDQMAV